MKQLYFFSTLLFLTAFNYSQTIQIGAGAGSTIVTGAKFCTNELKGDLVLDFLSYPKYKIINLQGLDFLSEYNLSIKAKMLLPDFPIAFYGELSYNFLKGKGEVRIYDPVLSHIPLPDEAESNCNLVNASLGTEIRVPNQVVTPYLDLGVVISYLGDIKVETANDHQDYKVTFLKGGIRYGFEVGIGWDYKCCSNFLIGISSKFTRNNLFGKTSDEINLNTLRTNGYFLYEL